MFILAYLGGWALLRACSLAEEGPSPSLPEEGVICPGEGSALGLPCLGSGAFIIASFFTSFQILQFVVILVVFLCQCLECLCWEKNGIEITEKQRSRLCG